MATRVEISFQTEMKQRENIWTERTNLSLKTLLSVVLQFGTLAVWI